MAEIVPQLASLERKIGKLIEYCDALEAEKRSLEEQNGSMQLIVARQQAELKEQEERIRVLKLARSVSDSSEKAIDIKQKINEFVREIDKCINLLNR
ncbi:MAG TPA: hypothetical protein VD772_05220 [Anseongella sp.]|nr:hypothetical protein [Anseongella sp.]